MKITVIRHGKTRGNIEKRFTGATDDCLHSEGVEGIKALAASGIYPEITKLYTSPLKRCVETAAIIYPQHTTIVIDDFREINFGILEDLTYEEIIATPGFENFVWDPDEMSFPQGDNMRDFKRRCADAFEAVAQKDEGHVAIVMHGGVINSIMDHLFKEKANVIIDNGLGFTITLKDGKYSYTELGVTARKLPIGEYMKKDL